MIGQRHLAARWWGLAAWCCLVAAATHAADTAVRAEPGADLRAREEGLLRDYRELERSFLRLADLLAASDPRRSALLRSVFDKAREEQVGDRLATIVGLLEKGQLLKAGTSQQDAIEQFRALLDVLESGDDDRRFASTKEEVRQFLSRLGKMIAKQRDIEGSTEAGGSEGELAERQRTLAADARGLAGDIDGFARRIDAREPDAGERPVNQPGDAGQDDDAAAPDGKDGAAPGKPAGGGKPGDAGDGSAAEPEPTEDDDVARAKRTMRRLRAAEERMQKAREQLDRARRREARQEQDKAVEELETARAELEEILRQMREQEVERLLVQLEVRVREMLRAEKLVLSGVEKLAAGGGAVRERELEAARLGREQAGIGTAATKALALVRDDGTAVAIPQALEAVRDDAAQVATRLGRGDSGGTTRGICQDLVTGLEELLAALEKVRRDQPAEKQAAPAGGRPPQPGEQPLVDKLSELKMIRSLQMRVNTRTKRFAQLLADGAERAEEPALLEALDRLSERQRRIERAAHDIVTGRTED